MTDLASRYAAVRATLDAIDQSQILRFYDALDEAGKTQLLDQIQGIDWDETHRLIQSHVLTAPEPDLPADPQPAPYFAYEPAADHAAHYQKAHAAGEALLREGKVAAFCVAGGQGTRLGWDGPKGSFPATPTRQAPLFQVFAEYLLKAGEKFGKPVPWYVMTSPVNDAPTRAFFEQHNYFGLPKDQVMLFAQAMMPAVDMTTGKVLLAEKNELALSPNGHGGSLKALWTSGAVADMKQRGVTQISYFQVDNPLVKCVDPLFIGLHAIAGNGAGAQMSSKMLPKAEPKEKVGVFVVDSGAMRVIEYSNLPDALAEQRDEQGGLRFLAGSIAIHVISVDFVEAINAEGFKLPWNRAEKKVPYVDDAGHVIKPESPNAVKLETFVFDALPLTQASIVYETKREEEFAPIKNADTPADQPMASDSPATSKQMQSNRAGAWLEQAGVTIPRDSQGHVDAVIDLSPRTAIDPADLQNASLPTTIEPGGSVTL